MDNRNGRIYTDKELEAAMKADPQLTLFAQPMRIPATQRQRDRQPPRVGRNDLCPCGSRKKFKKCCLGKPIVQVVAEGEADGAQHGA